MKDYSIEIMPEEMPDFLNNLAKEKFTEDPEIYWKLAQCALYLKLINEGEC